MDALQLLSKKGKAVVQAVPIQEVRAWDATHEGIEREGSRFREGEEQARIPTKPHIIHNKVHTFLSREHMLRCSDSRFAFRFPNFPMSSMSKDIAALRSN